jgi:hypothetical protein
LSDEHFKVPARSDDQVLTLGPIALGFNRSFNKKIEDGVTGTVPVLEVTVLPFRYSVVDDCIL